MKWIKLSAPYPKNDEAHSKEIVVKKRKRRTVSTKPSEAVEAGGTLTNQETEQLAHADPVTSSADPVTPTADHVTATGEHVTSITELTSMPEFQINQLGTAAN